YGAEQSAARRLHHAQTHPARYPHRRPCRRRLQPFLPAQLELATRQYAPARWPGVSAVPTTLVVGRGPYPFTSCVSDAVAGLPLAPTTRTGSPSARPSGGLALPPQ